MSVVVDAERGSASNHYDLLARLAAGGMAEIFLARANSTAGLERYVVLKRIRPEHGDDPRWVRMFLDEARLAAQLQHPNVAQVFDLGQIGDDYFFTMEYVHGKDLLEILNAIGDRNELMPIHVALAIAAGAAAGLAHAHTRCGADGRSLGIVHRDISPSNLMVSYEGTVKVVDFGVAKARSRSHDTEAGTIMGKVAYLSPEQCRTGGVDHRSDIFSLGIVLYEMLTQQRAFKREGDYATLRAVMREMPPRPSTIRELPTGLDELVMRALQKNPDDRFANVTVMLDAIEEIIEAESLSLTSGTLRRYMANLFGVRPEPWRVFDEVEVLDERDLVPASTRTIAGLPFDIDAAQVPMLQATGMIDISALFARDLSSASLPRQLDRILPTPPRIPSGSVPPIDRLADRLADRAPRAGGTYPVPARHSAQLPAQLAVSGSIGDGPVEKTIAEPARPVEKTIAERPREHTIVERRRSSVVTVSATVVVVLALAIGGYLLFAGRSSDVAASADPHVPMPAPTPRPIVQPIEPKAEAKSEPPKPVAVEVEMPAEPVAKPPVAPAVPVPVRAVGSGSAKTDAKIEAKPDAKPASAKCDDPLDCQY